MVSKSKNASFSNVINTNENASIQMSKVNSTFNNNYNSNENNDLMHGSIKNNFSVNNSNSNNLNNIVKNLKANPISIKKFGFQQSNLQNLNNINNTGNMSSVNNMSNNNNLYNLSKKNNDKIYNLSEISSSNINFNTPSSILNSKNNFPSKNTDNNGSNKNNNQGFNIFNKNTAKPIINSTQMNVDSKTNTKISLKDDNLDKTRVNNSSTRNSNIISNCQTSNTKQNYNLGLTTNKIQNQSHHIQHRFNANLNDNAYNSNSSIKLNNFKSNKNSHFSNDNTKVDNNSKSTESEIIVNYNRNNEFNCNNNESSNKTSSKNYNVNVNINNIYNNGSTSIKENCNDNIGIVLGKERIFSVGNSPNKNRLDKYNENKNNINLNKNLNSDIDYKLNFKNSRENSPYKHKQNQSKVISSVTEYIEENEFNELFPTSIPDQVLNIESNSNNKDLIFSHNDSNIKKSELLNYNKFSTQLKKKSEDKHTSNSTFNNITSNLNNTYNKPNSNVNLTYTNSVHINSSLLKANNDNIKNTSKQVQFNNNSKSNLQDNVNLINNNNSEEHPYLKNKSLLRSTNLSPNANEGFIYNRTSISRLNNISSGNLKKESNQDSNSKFLTKNQNNHGENSNDNISKNLNTSPSDYTNVNSKIKNIYECDDISVSCKEKEKLGLSIKEVNNNKIEKKNNKVSVQIDKNVKKTGDSESNSDINKKLVENSVNISIDLNQMMDPEEIHFTYVKLNKHSKYNLSKFESEFID